MQGRVRPRHQGLVRLAVGVAIGLGGLTLWAPTSNAHLVGYTGEISHDLLMSASDRQCVYWNGNCSLHSFGYISMSGGSGWRCAEKYLPSYPGAGTVDDAVCEFGTIARLCTTHQAHAGGSGPLHCQDQDVNNWKVGGQTASAAGTYNRHALY